MARKQASEDSKTTAGMSSEERALNNAMNQIEKAFGAGAIMKLGEGSLLEIEGISTGALSLDLALGGKGLPRGRIVELFGPESSGKTTHCPACHCQRPEAWEAWRPLSTPSTRLTRAGARSWA